jgi:nicotinamide riboside transporter PnuC
MDYDRNGMWPGLIAGLMGGLAVVFLSRRMAA